jgi:hypothetical protein
VLPVLPFKGTAHQKASNRYGHEVGVSAVCVVGNDLSITTHKEVAVAVTFTANARRLGIVSAVGTALLTAVYVTTLIAGLMSLRSPQDPIDDPAFSILEVVIILTLPFMVALMVAIHAWAAPENKVFSLMALVFTSLLAVITCGVHFVILTVSRQALFSGNPWMPLLLSFKWPSISYALDILAWDVFFALSVLFAAPVFSGNRLAPVHPSAAGCQWHSGPSRAERGHRWRYATTEHSESSDTPESFRSQRCC